MRQKVFMLIALLLATAGLLCTASCDSVVWGADIKSYVDAGLSNVFIRNFSTSPASPTKSVPSREVVTVTVSVVNPETLSLQASLDCPGAPLGLSFTLPQWLGSDYESLSFTFTAPEGAERTTLPFALSFHAPATAKDYPDLPIPIRVDSPPDAPALAFPSYTADSKSFVAFLLPEGYRNEDIVAVRVTATGEIAGGAPKTERLTVQQDGDLARWSPPGAAPNDGYTYSFVCIDAAGLESEASAAFEQDNRYLVFYNANGGTGLVLDQKGYDVPDPVTLLPATALSREGYVFAAWNSAEDGSGESHTPGEAVLMAMGGLEFWAQWTPVEYTVHFELAGGLLPAGATNPFAYTIEDETITLPLPTRPGYSFGGWYDNVDLTGPAVTEIPTGSTGDKTFYAQWETSPYTIKWNLNDSDLFPATNNPENPVNFDVTDSFAFVAPTRPGFAFDGWYENADFTGTALTALPAGTARNLELYAKWMALSYTISWNLGATSDYPATNDSSNPASYTSGQTPAFEPPTRPGFTFDGWFDNDDLMGTALTALPAGTARNLELYAKWTALSYTISWNLGATSDYPATNDSSNPASYTSGQTPAFVAPTRPGFAFDGWYENADFTGTALTALPEGTARNLELHAKWTVLSYTISWQLGASSDYPAINAPANPASYTSGQTPSFAAPTRPGFTFTGWYDNDDLTGTALTALPAGSYGDKAYHAKWTVLSYTITWDLNDLTASPATNAPSNPAIYTSGQTLAFEEPTRPGFTFDGWFDNADFEGTFLAALPEGSYGDKTYYAKWTIIAYSVTYTLNDGSLPAGTENPFTYTIEDETIVLPQPSRTGYRFDGWFDNADFTGTALTALPAGSYGDKTYYAKWVELADVTINMDVSGQELVFTSTTMSLAPNSQLQISCTNTALVAGGTNWVWRVGGTVNTTQTGSSFTWTPTVADIGQHIISCEVTYQGLVYSGSVTVTVDY